MPMYEYEMIDTGEVVEVHQPASEWDKPLAEIEGRPVRKIPSLFRTERQFHGRESVSVMEGCHPEEVGQYRKIVGDNGRVRDDGAVEFDNRGQQRRFVKRLAEAGVYND